MATERLQTQIKIFEAKKQTLFQRIQRLYDYTKNLDDPRTLQKFQTMYMSLEETRTQLSELVEKINLLNIELNSEYTPNFQLLDAIDQLYCVIQESAKITFKTESSRTSQGDTLSNSLQTSKVKPKLPKLEIKAFNGDPKMWPVFYGMYTSLIHNNNELDDTCKVSYLLSVLNGRALAICSGIPPIAENYQIIWKTLVDTYHDKRSLASIYLKQILEFKPLQHESEINLNAFLERFDTSVNALKKLDVPDLADFLLMYIALSKLDNQTKRSFEIDTKDVQIPTYNLLADFVKRHVKIVSRTSNTNYNSTLKPNSSNVKPKNTHSFVNTNSKLDICPVCSQDSHLVNKCAKFLKLSPQERYQIAKEKYLCLNCLSNKHKITACKSLNTCSFCRVRHHSLLHFKRETPNICPSTNNNNHNASTSTFDVPAADSNQPPPNQTTLSLFSTSYSSKNLSKNYTTLLSTAIVYIQLPTGVHKKIRVLLDSASQANFLSLKCCKKLQLPYNKIYSSVVGIGACSKPIKGQVNDATIFSQYDKNIKIQFNALIIDKITENLPTAVIDVQRLNYLKNLPLADAEFYKPSEIDGILGAELFPQLIRDGKISSTPDLPVALQTIFGYVIMGKTPTICAAEETFSFCSLITSPLEKMMHNFFEIEDVPSVKLDSPENFECENNFLSTYSRDNNGRYEVSLPFKNSPSNLGDSYSNALRRFLSLEKKLNISLDLRSQYNSVIQDYLDQGHMRKVNDEINLQLPSYYIPHHPVFKTCSSSTPLRVVFDASAKTDRNFSLNDILHTGPKLQSDVLVMFLNFRLYPIAFTADIRQMYRQVNLCKDHQRFQRILWRFCPSDPLEILEITTLAFGVKPSPFLAIRVIHQLANDEAKNFPRASELVLRDMYIDDLVSSVPNINDANLLYNELINLFNSGGFNLVKWSVNSKDFLQSIPEEKRLLNVRNFENDSLKVLGMQWHPNLDILFFKVNISSRECSKRNILSTVAQIFDPLGLIAPVTLYAKLLIKKLWLLKLGWDQRPPEEIIEQWGQFQTNLPLLEKFAVPRHIGIFEQPNAILIGFADACETSYGAVLYLKTFTDSGEIKTNLVCAKSKVSPLKIVSIPRLELCAAVLLSKLIHFVISTYRSRYNITKVYAFSDSTVVLHWIYSSPHRWKTFVANRVSKIHSTLPQNIWFHVDGKNNAADCLSRGLTPNRFLEISTTWLTGPHWLSYSESHWPIKTYHHMKFESPFLEEKIVSLPTIENANNQIYNSISRHSSWLKLIRTIVIVLRFVKLLPLRKEILISDIDTAEYTLIRIIQNIHFKKDIVALENGKECSSELRKLHPFIENNIIRVGGRLSHSSLVYDHKYPILLPKKDHFVNILIDYYHRKYFHTGPHLLLSLLRQKYWILSARNIVRQRISRCNFCFKFKPKPTFPLMADLPSARVITQIKPFIETGVDYAGPYYITLSRHRGVKSQKAYICLFVCLTTKCVHLELASDLSTSTFLAAFKRFLSRRGPIRAIHSDCGTNFIGAKAQLDQFYAFITSSEYTNAFKDELTQNKINWIFNTPAAPHMGGIWESNIKCVKVHLSKVLGSQILSYEEFATVLTQIEALLNSRPLCWLSSDPSDPEVLTPAHFLTLTPLKYLPAIDVSDFAMNTLKRKELLDNLVQSYWSRWKSEYLSGLQMRQKWNTPTYPVKIGTVVLIIQENIPPLQWPVGVIEDIFPGTDGVIRTALVRTKNSRFRRPVVKLCPLPVQ